MVANIRAKVIPNYTVMDVLKATFQEAAEAVRSKPHCKSVLKSLKINLPSEKYRTRGNFP